MMAVENTQFAGAVAVPKLDDCRAQTKSRTLGKEAEEQSDKQTGQRNECLFTEPLNKAAEIHVMPE